MARSANAGPADTSRSGGMDLEAMMLSRNIPGTRERLKAARVAIAGAGGLGSNIAASLARMGVGELLLVDHDIVEPGNLNRQHYGVSHLGMKKVGALKSQLADISPHTVVKTADAYITADNADSLFGGYDIVCEALDAPESKAALVSALLSKLPNVKIVAASGIAGAGSSNDMRTNISRAGQGRLYVCGDGSTDEGEGLMSPRVLICAGHQANMVLRLILGIEAV